MDNELMIAVGPGDVALTDRRTRGWVERRRWSCRASVRRRSHPTFHIDDVGFRVARSTTS